MYNKNRISLGIRRSNIYLVVYFPFDFGQVTQWSSHFFLAIKQHGRIAERINEVLYI